MTTPDAPVWRLQFYRLVCSFLLRRLHHGSTTTLPRNGPVASIHTLAHELSCQHFYSTKDKVGIGCKLDIAGVQIVSCDYDSNATSSTEDGKRPNRGKKHTSLLNYSLTGLNNSVKQRAANVRGHWSSNMPLWTSPSIVSLFL
jgi:hypothetical protein